MELITIKLFEDLLEMAEELKAERHWWKDEARCSYQKDYAAMEDTIEKAKQVLKSHKSKKP